MSDRSSRLALHSCLSSSAGASRHDTYASTTEATSSLARKYDALPTELQYSARTLPSRGIRSGRIHIALDHALLVHYTSMLRTRSPRKDYRA